MLGEIGLPENEIPTSLLFFNVGVEIGQLLFIGVLIAVGAVVVAVYRTVLRSPLRPALWQPVTAYLIGTVACYWTIERIASF